MKNITKTKAGYTVPPVTKHYHEELEKEVRRYMADRHDYLCQGHHPLADLSYDSYVRSLARFFELSYEEVEQDFDKLGQRITDEKNQRYLDEQFANAPEHKVTQQHVDQLIKLREEFIKNRPTKGWATKKMDMYRYEYQAEAANILGFVVEDYEEGINVKWMLGKSIKVSDNTVFYIERLFPTSDYPSVYDNGTNFIARTLLDKGGYNRETTFELVVKDKLINRVNNKIY